MQFHTRQPKGSARPWLLLEAAQECLGAGIQTEGMAMFCDWLNLDNGSPAGRTLNDGSGLGSF